MMADQELRTILTSGSIDDIKIGDTEANSSVAKKSYVLSEVSSASAAQAAYTDQEVGSLRNEVITQRGLLGVGASAAISNSITTSYSTITLVDSILFDGSNNHIEYDFVNNRVVLKEVGVYLLIASGGARFPKAEDFTLTYSITPTPSGVVPEVTFNGNDAKNVGIYDTVLFEVTQAMLDGAPSGEVWVQIQAKGSAADTLSIQHANLIIEKKL
jgi:hypothetical protein